MPADDDSRQHELRELRPLVERIKREDCVLVLGPRVSVREDDTRPLDERLAQRLLESIGQAPESAPLSFRHAADLYYRQQNDLDELQLTVAEFYRGGIGTTDFHRNLAALPFRLCVSASPDDLMFTAFAATPGKSPQKGWYNFRNPLKPRLGTPTSDKPLVYHLFGHYEDPTSLVLTEGDLIEFLLAVVRGTPLIPDQVRSMLTPTEASFLFIGFGFQNWYLRVLLPVMNVYGHRSKGIAFEDERFFEHPERAQTVSFFSGDRRIDFRPLRWDGFARQLREVYEESLPKPQAAQQRAISGPPPTVFLSYASEDRADVDALAQQLAANGIKVWQDHQDLRAGDNWRRVLFDVIGQDPRRPDRVDYFVVVQTQTMASRTEGIYNNEIEAALQRQSGMRVPLRFLIPVKIGAGCPDLPLLRTLHSIDISTPAGVGSLVESLLDDWERRKAPVETAVAGA